MIKSRRDFRLVTMNIGMFLCSVGTTRMFKGIKKVVLTRQTSGTKGLFTKR
jgi:hypothetical protein